MPDFLTQAQKNVSAGGKTAASEPREKEKKQQDLQKSSSEGVEARENKEKAHDGRKKRRKVRNAEDGAESRRLTKKGPGSRKAGNSKNKKQRVKREKGWRPNFILGIEDGPEDPG